MLCWLIQETLTFVKGIREKAQQAKKAKAISERFDVPMSDATDAVDFGFDQVPGFDHWDKATFQECLVETQKVVGELRRISQILKNR